MLIQNGYVASYNVPYNQTLQAISDDSTNYTSDPRAILFHKYAPNITNFNEFIYVMRLNNFSDTQNHCQAIAARCDLESAGGQPPFTQGFPFGSVDCKATNDQLVGQHQAWIQDGPTYELNPPFTWADWPQYANDSLGMPSLWNFPWVYYDPASNFTTFDSLLENYQYSDYEVNELISE